MVKLFNKSDFNTVLTFSNGGALEVGATQTPCELCRAQICTQYMIETGECDDYCVCECGGCHTS